MERNDLHTMASLLSWPNDMVEALERAIAKVERDEKLKEAVHTLRQQMFPSDDRSYRDAEPMTTLEEERAQEQLLRMESHMGEHRGMLAAVVFACELPRAFRRMAAEGIEQRILLDTFSDFAIWMNNYKQQHGVWGLGEVGWMCNHFTGRLYRIGRLQYKPKPFVFKDRIVRHRHTGETKALAADNVRYDTDGYRYRVPIRDVEADHEYVSDAGSDSSGAPADALDAREIVGRPFDALGRTATEPVRLPADEWEIVLEHGSDVLEVHIPQGEKLSHEACAASYKQAKRFFTARYPERSFRAFVCSTWLLSPQFRSFLPPESNIMRFQSDYYVLPEMEDDTQMFERVFGAKPEKLSAAPRDTALRKAILDYYEAGGRTNKASGIILFAEVDSMNQVVNNG